MPTTRQVVSIQEGSIISNLKKHPPRITIAFDLTGSNGDPTEDSSLHSRKNENNRYRSAILKFADIFSGLSQRVPSVFGFGFNKRGFPAFRPENKSGYNVDLVERFSGGKMTTSGPGFVLSCYEKILQEIVDGTSSLSGPTWYEEVLRNFVAKCSSNDHEILILFTDGSPNDKNEFIRSVGQLRPNISVIVINVCQEFDDYDVKSYTSKGNVLTCGWNQLGSGQVYSDVMTWVENRASQIV